MHAIELDNDTWLLVAEAITELRNFADGGFSTLSEEDKARLNAAYEATTSLRASGTMVDLDDATWKLVADAISSQWEDCVHTDEDERRLESAHHAITGRPWPRDNA